VTAFQRPPDMRKLISLASAFTCALAVGLVFTACQPASPPPPAPPEPAPAPAADEAGPWLTDYEAAKTRAKAEKKHILLDFTGSDWCPPCKALHNGVFVKPEFLDYAKDNLVLVMVDFPESKPQSETQKRLNQELSELFKVEGFPTVIVQDAGGRELKREVGYSGESAADYVAKLKVLKP
jgi:protein disulfide-isomerase